MNPDFVCIFGDFSTVWTIKAVSEEAKAFANENFSVESWMGTPENLTTDWRPARDLAYQLAAEGFLVGRKVGVNFYPLKG